MAAGGRHGTSRALQLLLRAAFAHSRTSPPDLACRTSQRRRAHHKTPARNCSTSAAAGARAATGVPDRTRFVVELEFIQCLANPFYLNCERRAPAPASLWVSWKRVLPLLLLLLHPSRPISSRNPQPVSPALSPPLAAPGAKTTNARAGPEPVPGGPRVPALPTVPRVLAAARVRALHQVRAFGWARRRPAFLPTGTNCFY
jgi:hypothetical protein